MRPTDKRWVDDPEADLGLRLVGASHEILRLGHSGWYVDTIYEDTCEGRVYRLPHGRYLAGYTDGFNPDAVCLDVRTVYDCERDAAHAAEEMARIYAEDARESFERGQAAWYYYQALEDRAQLRYEILDVCRARSALGDSARSIVTRLMAERYQIGRKMRELADTWGVEALEAAL